MTSTRWMTGVLIAAALTAQAQADVKTKAVTYTHDGVTFKGHLAWDDATVGKRPGILVVHEWWGINEYAKKRAEQLAALGYVAFAADMYGDGKTTDNPKESGQWAGALRKDIKTWRGRAAASLKVLEDDDKVDAAKLASIGYCFGGSTSIMLAHTGANVKAVVSFHGALLVPEADQAKAIKAKILICHGADDAFIPEETIQKTKAAYDANKVDYLFESYPGAVHSFTVRGADDRGNKGMRYDEKADKQSWESMRKLFKERLK